MLVVWSLPAVDDLERIFAYLHTRNPAAARMVVQTIYDSCATLTDFRMRARKNRLPDRYELVFTGLPYIAVYRIGQNQVEIIRIYHHAQNWL